MRVVLEEQLGYLLRIVDVFQSVHLDVVQLLLLILRPINANPNPLLVLVDNAYRRRMVFANYFHRIELSIRNELAHLIYYLLICRYKHKLIS